MNVSIIKCIFATIATFLVTYLGGWNIGLRILCLVVVLDYLTGFLRAGYHKKWNSKTGLKGIIKKIFYFILVALAVIIDDLIGANSLIREGVIYFFIANEGLSIIENCADCGLPIPPKIKEMLEQLKGKENE